MRSVIRRFVCDTSGATAIEYCLIAGLVSILIVTGATAIGERSPSLLRGDRTETA